jgi:hypothetical protein
MSLRPRFQRGKQWPARSKRRLLRRFTPRDDNASRGVERTPHASVWLQELSQNPAMSRNRNTIHSGALTVFLIPEGEGTHNHSTSLHPLASGEDWGRRVPRLSPGTIAIPAPISRRFLQPCVTIGSRRRKDTVSRLPDVPTWRHDNGTAYCALISHLS